MPPRAVRGGLGDRPRQEARDKESAAGIAMENVQSMDDSNLRDDITGLEARIEALADSMDRCRKIAFASKLVVAAGAVWIALMALGAIPFAPVNIVGSIAAVLGGIVLFGSNASTRKQTAAAIEQAQAFRAELIGRIDLTIVGDDRARH